MTEAITIAAFDLGQTGAYAVLECLPDKDPILLALEDTPIIGKETDCWRVSSMLKLHQVGGVYCERVHTQGRNGRRANFSMGFSLGALHGCTQAMRLPLVRVAPHTWQEGWGLLGKDKEAARLAGLEALNRLGADPKLLARVKDHNRADALLLGLHCSETLWTPAP